ncbi:ATP-dependent DNA helicase PIF1-like [Camellia sinensis]|uniref:ATP-dependent DNA helicase PIF1-like n=1 Tax=Camellia sinensis TaxID=4442 RepID=UPI0010359392|nr:ATP-dependent DNA helicase PIF1-like [Camellia sinensis]
MAKRQAIEALDEMLRDITDSNLLFGGKVMVFGGDFRQVFLVVPKDFTKYSNDPLSMMNNAILTPKNESVDHINQLLIKRFPGTQEQYMSIDETIETSQQGQYEDFLNSLNPIGLPPRKLLLKLNCPILMLRNIDPSKGLCIGTRLICRKFERHFIFAEIAVGDHKGNTIFLPRIPLQPSNRNMYPIQFTRRQFPIRLCLSVIINKSQGQTLETVGIYLSQPVFSHGQLYVVLSRATTLAKLRILIEPQDSDSDETNSTTNIVFHELLSLAQCT